MKVRQIKELEPVRVTPGEALDKKGAEVMSKNFGIRENMHDHRKVTFPITTIGKIVKHQGFDVSTIIYDMANLYETSMPAWSEAEAFKAGHKPHNNIKAYHNYVNKFTDGDGEYFVRFTVTEIKAGKKAKPRELGDSFIHSTTISDVTIYENDEFSDRVRLMVPGVKKTSSFVDKKLQEFFDSVKVNSAKAEDSAAWAVNRAEISAEEIVSRQTFADMLRGDLAIKNRSHD